MNKVDSDEEILEDVVPQDCMEEFKATPGSVRVGICLAAVPVVAWRQRHWGGGVGIVGWFVKQV